MQKRWYYLLFACLGLTALIFFCLRDSPDTVQQISDDDLYSDASNSLTTRPHDAYHELGDGIFALSNGEASRALAHFREAIRLDDHVMLAHVYSAELIEDNDPATAIEDYTNAIRVYGKTESPIISLNDILLKRALLLLDRGEYDAVVKDLTTVLESDSKHFGARAHRARAYYLMRSWSDALKDLDVALELDGKNVKLLLFQGATYFEMQRFHDALKSYQAAALLDPESKAAKGMIERTSNKLGQPAG